MGVVFTELHGQLFLSSQRWIGATPVAAAHVEVLECPLDHGWTPLVCGLGEGAFHGVPLMPRAQLVLPLLQGG